MRKVTKQKVVKQKLTKKEMGKLYGGHAKFKAGKALDEAVN